MNINETVLTKMKERFRDYLDSPDNISSKDGENTFTGSNFVFTFLKIELTNFRNNKNRKTIFMQ